jgi:ubiquinone/menaquinone biosynthesis C-methylase UbiE
MNIHEWIRPSKRRWRKLREAGDVEAVRGGYNEQLMGVDPEELAFHRWLAERIEAIPTAKNAKVLDAGCGSGPLSQALRARGFSDITAFDISDANLAAAKAHAHAAFRSSAEDIQARDETYDLVASINMIEHVMEPKQVLAEFFRVLKPGGVLFLTTDNSWWQTMMTLRRFITLPSTWYHRKPQPIDGDFTACEMKGLLKQAGFVDADYKGIGGIAVGDRLLQKLVGPTGEHPLLKGFTTRLAFTARRPSRG